MERILIVDFASTQAWAKGVAPSANREGGGGEADRGRCGQALERLTSTHHRRGGYDVPPAGGVPGHRHCATSGVHPLASV
jgi:hypothetical protein